MTKQPDRQPGSDPRQLSIEELDNVAGGHGVSVPPPGFDLEPSSGGSSSRRANWGSVTLHIDRTSAPSEVS